MRTQQTEQRSNVIPGIEAAIETWYEIRNSFQAEPCQQNLTAYDKATNELGQFFVRWQDAQPELFEQIRLFLIA
jgi:hypothetical protein